jgi:hypothetical protein
MKQKKLLYEKKNYCVLAVVLVLLPLIAADDITIDVYFLYPSGPEKIECMETRIDWTAAAEVNDLLATLELPNVLTPRQCTMLDAVQESIDRANRENDPTELADAVTILTGWER